MAGRRAALVLAIAAGAAAPAQAAWQEASSTHFVVYSDDTPEAVRAFTDRLERYDHALRLLNGLDEERTSRATRVTVFVVKNEGAVSRLAHDSGVAGFYIPKAEGPVAFTPRTDGDGSMTALTAQEVLFHEYAHHVTFMAWGGTALPAWFLEGFAEFNATAIFDANGGMTFGLPPYYRARNMLKLEAMPLRALLTVDPNTLFPEPRDVFYGRAWLLVHYLRFDAGRAKQLGEYIDRIGKGEPPIKAAAVFGDLGKLDVELNRYARRPRITVRTVAAGALAIGSVSVRPLTPAEAAAMPALILSKRGKSTKTAGGALAPARAAAAAWPADPFVLNELAEAEYDAGHYAESRSAAARALVTDPKSIHALMYAGMARMAVAAKAKDKSPATWADVRHWFGTANRLDPDDAWPQVMYYRSYRAAGQQPNANVQAGLLYAHGLAPFDPDVSLLAGEVLLREGKAEDARTALRPVAYNPHGGTASITARAVLEKLDAGGAIAALAVLDGNDRQDTAATGKAAAGG